MIELLVREPILLLLLVAAFSYPLGRIRLGGASLGFAEAACAHRIPVARSLVRLPSHADALRAGWGVLAAVQTEPAVLGFGLEQSRRDLPNLTYARLYPLALIAKILLAQILYAMLSRGSG